VGVIGGFIGIWLIFRQVRIAKQSADAASNNALALMNAERAWISVDVRILEVMPNPVELVIKNCGRTPAFISEIRGIIVQSIQELPPEPPDESILMRQCIIAPNESFPVALKESLDLGAFPDQIIVGRIVRYATAYSDKERLELPPCTRFCYRGRRTKNFARFIFTRVFNEFYNSYR
jgi:hypothetical protein